MTTKKLKVIKTVGYAKYQCGSTKVERELDCTDDLPYFLNTSELEGYLSDQEVRELHAILIELVKDLK